MNIIIYGDDKYLVEKAINDTLHKLKVEENELALHTFVDSFEPILEDLNSMPFFADRRVVVVRNSVFLTTSKKVKVDLKPFEKYLSNPCETSILILVADCTKLDGRLGLIKKYFSEEFILERNSLTDTQMVDYITKFVDSKGYKIEYVTATNLAKRVGYDMSHLVNELDKLLIYLGNDTTITNNLVEGLVTRAQDVNTFALSNNILNSNKELLMKSYKELLDSKEEPVLLLRRLTFYLSTLITFATYLDCNFSKDQIVEKMHIKASRYYFLEKAVSSHSRSKIYSLFNQLVQLEENIVLKGNNAHRELELFLLKA